MSCFFDGFFCIHVALGSRSSNLETLPANVDFNRTTPVNHSTDKIVDVAGPPFTDMYDKIISGRERMIAAFSLFLGHTPGKTPIQVRYSPCQSSSATKGTACLQLSVADTVRDM